MKRQKREFSKILLAAVMVTYFGVTVFAIFVVQENPELLGELLTFVGAPTAVAIGFYAYKAKCENVVKISRAVSADKKLDSDTKKQIVNGVAGVLNDAFGNNDFTGGGL